MPVRKYDTKYTDFSDMHFLCECKLSFYRLSLEMIDSSLESKINWSYTAAQ